MSKGVIVEIAIDVRDLVVERGKREVLHGITTQVARGVVTGLLGPSGGGKTTLMRAIVGTQIVKSGAVEIFGHPAGSKPLRDRVGYVTQSPSVYADLTVQENVRYFGALYGRASRDAARALADVGLEAQADQLVSTLSGGQRARASLACALVGNPEVLVLDEPTVGLDPVLREDLWRQFRALAEDGVTILVSSHVMDEASRCDRLVLLRDGTIIADDTPDEIKAAAGTDDMDKAFLTLIEKQEAI
jgi:ABC-2 type transport system ATP-binding protein